MTNQTVVERWKQGQPSEDELRALPVTIGLVDVARAYGIGQELAYREVNQSYDPATNCGVLAGVKLMKLGRRWVGAKADLLRSLGMIS